MALTTDDYLAQLQSLLPPGPAWPRDPDSNLTRLLLWMAEELALIDDRIEQLIDEADPRTALELLTDWERVTGLPDTCDAGIATTVEERRAAVRAKLIATGGASEAYFRSICEELGYDVVIDRFRPFICGISRCGDVLNGAPSVRHTWRVRVLGPRVTYFRTGQSQCGDLLGKISRATDLECKLNRLKQAHTKLIVAYEGA